MNIHEKDARKYKIMGNNCSSSLHKAFKEDTDISNEYPDPRSINRKCGALLTALKILDDTGNLDKKEEFEKKFIEKFGYSKCMDLMAHERRCEDYVGISAQMIDEILEK